MGRVSEVAESIATGDQLRSGPMSKEALLMQLGFMAADLRRIVLDHPGCLSERQEAQVASIRMDLESVARVGGVIKAYIEGTDHEPMPSLMQAAE